MKEYALGFIKKHGERLFYMFIVSAFSASFLFVESMQESGKTLLIAVATLALNKARSPQKNDEQTQQK